MGRFLVAAMPFSGHVAPLTAVAEALVARGHDVRFYTGARFAERVQRVGAQHVPWRQAPDFDENDLAATFPRLRGRPGLAQVFVNLREVMIGTAPAQVADLQAEWDAEDWDVLVTEETSVGGALFAERTGIRWATVAVLPLQLATAQGPPSGLGLTPGAAPLTRARDAVLRALVPVMATPLRGPLQRARAAAGIDPSRARFDQTVFSPQLVLASGCPLLDFARTDRPRHLRFVGVLSPAPRDETLPEWWPELDGRTVVYVTQGTQNIDPTDLLRPALEALAGDDMLVVATTGIRGRDVLPFPAPGNARVAGLLPYASLLPRVDLAVTNGGWGGTLAMLGHGIPLVIAGRDLDKPEVAARAAWSGAAANLRTGRPSPEAVGEAVHRVLYDRDFRQAARRVATQLAGGGGAARAAALLERMPQGAGSR